MWRGRWYPKTYEQSTEIRYYTVEQSLLLWHNDADDSTFLQHFSLDEYIQKYIVPHGLVFDKEHHEDWLRSLRTPNGRVNILCCPEDVEYCGRHSNNEMCARCRWPVCNACMNEIAVGRPRSIPMALGHDLLFGYTTELLTQHKVRWIEMAAVLPMWTHMIVYYVEGNAGHVMNQVVGKAEWRSNVKGQCFSFIMPWAQLIREFKTRMERDDLLSLPRGEHTLQYLFRIHLKVAGEAFTDDLRQVRLRPYVLLLLLSWLWRTRPDLFDRKTRSQKAFMAEMQRRIQELYPETEGHLPEEEREGQIPTAFQ